MDYDLVVIGAGWAGVNAASCARAAGLKVSLIEKGQIGGTCLNRGCIPTKALIQSAKTYSLLKKAARFGIEPAAGAPLYPKIKERKDRIVAELRAGMQGALAGIDVVSGPATLVSGHEVKAGGRQLSTRFILIATGSRPIELPGLKFDGARILSSDQILELDTLPATLLIVGAGAIGCEFASLFAGLGTAVTLVEKMPQLLPGEDRETARRLENCFKKKRIAVRTSAEATLNEAGAFERVLVCVGRAPFAEGLGAEKIGVKLERGTVVVDDYLRTALPTVYAAGDCTGRIMLAHYAAYQGRLAAQNIIHPDVAPSSQNIHAVPNCIFTDPEVASVGYGEEAARAAGIETRICRFDFMGSGMARILDETDGFIKIVCDARTDRVVGASLIGPRVTELVATLGVAVAQRLTAAQLRETIFAHPTLSEAIHEAVQAR